LQQFRTPPLARAVSALVVALAASAVPFSSVVTSSPAGAEITGAAFTSVVAGVSNSCALSTSRLLYCWGTNHYGQLLNGTVVPRYVPTPLNLKPWLGASSIASFVTGNGTTCVLDNTSRVLCWGYGGQGQIGDGLYANSRAPELVRFPPTKSGSVIQIAGTGASSFCALTATSQVFCWGGNVYGQLGNQTTFNAAVPVQVDPSGALKNQTIASIAGSEQTFCALSTSQHAYCWGYGLQGALGNGALHNSSQPVLVDATGALSGHGLVAIAPASDHTCAIDSVHNVYCWGSNRSGTLGLNLPNGTTHTSSWRSTPQYVGGLSGLAASAISSSATESCALSGVGHIYCWGAQPLGDGEVSGMMLQPELLKASIIAGLKIVAISSGPLTTCAIDTLGSLYCWGQNTEGSVGSGATGIVSAPVEIAASPSTVPVASVPSAPIGVAVNPGNGSAIVTWSPPVSNGNAPVTSYIVSTTPATKSCVVTKLSCTMLGLNPVIGYVFSVVAHNAAGDGTPATSGLIFAVNPSKFLVETSSHVQSINVSFIVVAAGLRKGSVVTFSMPNSPRTSCAMTAIRQCFVIMKQPRPGSYRIVAKQSGYVATINYWSPSVMVPSVIIHGHTATIRLTSCPPRFPVKIVLSDHRVYRATASSLGAVTVLIPMPNKGHVGVLIQVGGTQLVPDHTINVV